MTRRKTTKLKAPATPVPQTREQADQLIGEIGAAQRAIDDITARLEADIAQLKAVAAAAAAPFATRIMSHFVALTAWASANKDALLEGKRRSVELSQGVIGWRWSNPTVKVAKGKEDDVIKALRERGARRLLRYEVSIDKNAILKEPDRIEGIPHIEVVQVENFFVKPFAVEAEHVAAVTKLTGAAATQPAEEAPKTAKAA